MVTLALEEIVATIMSGDGREDDQRIHIELAMDGQDLTARVDDDAAAFDGVQTDGLNLVTTLMDEVTYSRERDRRVLRLRKSTTP